MRRAKRKVEGRWSEWRMFAAQLQLAAVCWARGECGPQIAARLARGIPARPRKRSKKQAELFDE